MKSATTIPDDLSVTETTREDLLLGDARHLGLRERPNTRSWARGARPETHVTPEEYRKTMKPTANDPSGSYVGRRVLSHEHPADTPGPRHRSCAFALDRRRSETVTPILARSSS